MASTLLASRQVPSGGGSSNVGNAVLDFGAFPGKSDASVNVTGQGSIGAGSTVNAWITPAASADHSADEHMLETIKIMVGNILPGTGFTIYGLNNNQINEPLEFRTSIGGRGTMLYGQWNIKWQWN